MQLEETEDLVAYMTRRDRLLLFCLGAATVIATVVVALVARTEPGNRHIMMAAPSLDSQNHGSYDTGSTGEATLNEAYQARLEPNLVPPEAGEDQDILQEAVELTCRLRDLLSESEYRIRSTGGMYVNGQYYESLGVEEELQHEIDEVLFSLESMVRSSSNVRELLLEDLGTHSHLHYRAAICTILGRVGDFHAKWEVLRFALGHEGTPWAEIAVLSLAQVDPQKETAEFYHPIPETGLYMTWRAAVRDPRIRGGLVSAVRTVQDPELRDYALRALSESAEYQEVGDLLREALLSDDESLRQSAVSAIEIGSLDMEPDVQGQLVAWLEPLANDAAGSPRGEDALYALAALKEANIPALERLTVGRREPGLRMACQDHMLTIAVWELLGRWEDEPRYRVIVPTLRRSLLGDVESEVRAKAARSLASIGYWLGKGDEATLLAAEAALRQAMQNDMSEEVREAAADGLREIRKRAGE